MHTPSAGCPSSVVREVNYDIDVQLLMDFLSRFPRVHLDRTFLSSICSLALHTRHSFPLLPASAIGQVLLPTEVLEKVVVSFV